jgi:hypothetical protein
VCRATCLFKVDVVDGNFARESVVTVGMRDIAFIFDVSAAIAELAFTQEMTEPSIVVLTPAPLVEVFAAGEFLHPRIFQHIHPVSSNCVREVSHTPKPSSDIGVDHVRDTECGVSIREVFVGDPRLFLIC